MSQAPLWIVDALADELAKDATQDRGSLLRGLVQRAGYEQADNLLAQDSDQVRAALVSRLVGRLARD